MAIRIRRPGGGPPATPLTAFEQRLADAIARSLRNVANSLEVERIVNAIQMLNPDGLEEVLRQVTIVVLEQRIANALAATYRAKAEVEFQRLILEDPRIGSMILQDQGVRLPSGIIVPRDLAEAAGFQFEAQINPAKAIITDYIDPRSVNYGATRGAALVADIDKANRTALRYVLRDGLAKGKSVWDLAKDIKDTVGLHTRWARAVETYKQTTMQQLIRSGMTAPQAKARTDTLVKRYRDRLIRRRAEMISRTEVQLAQNMARQTGWSAAGEAGVLDGRSMKEWVVAPSGSRRGEPCPTCQELAGKRVQWNAAFPTGHVMPPAHPHCRCTAVLVPPSRGLSGLPSQDMDAWLARLDALEEGVA